MWTGTEWIPTPPNSETEVQESSNHVENNDSLSRSYHISADNNSKYKVAGIFLSILSFFFPYIGSNSPFSIQFQGSAHLWSNVHFESISTMLDGFIHCLKHISCGSLLGLFGGHRFYIGDIRLGVIYLFTLGIFGIGWIADAFLLPNLIQSANKKITIER